MGRDTLRRYAVPLVAWPATFVVLIVLQFVSGSVLRQHRAPILPWQGLHHYLLGWSQYDGPEYLRIAQHGYFYYPGVRSTTVWFPLYPITVRGVERWLVHDYLVAGVLVAALGGFAAALVYWRWLGELDLTRAGRLVAYGMLALYPYAWYLYGVVHSDAVFLALVITAFLLVGHRRLVLGGLVGALATATRPTGPALIIGLAVFGLEREGVLVRTAPRGGWLGWLGVPDRFDRSKLRAASFAPLLSSIGLLAYCGYLWAKYGQPLLWETNERIYHPSANPWLKEDFLLRWVHFTDNPTYALTILAQAAVALVVLCTIPGVSRRFGFGYGVYLLVLVAIPTLSTEDFMGTGRYLIAAFPAFAYLGEQLALRARARVAWLGASGATMTALGMGFARSWYLT